MLPQVAYCKEGASSTDGEFFSTCSMEIAAFDEGGCKWVLFETEDFVVKAREVQLLDTKDELVRPIAKAKKARLSKSNL